MSTQINWPTWHTWNVTEFRTPRENSDPLGVFKIEEVARQATAHDDESCKHEPDSAEEQAALDKRNAVIESARLLIAAAPDLLAALEAIIPILDKVWSYDGDVLGTLHNDATDVDQAIRAAITKATGQ
jgi:hypothetical protein